MSRDDQILEQALKHELRSAAPPGAACVDAETFAAWQEGSLDVAAMAAVESHLSTCARCQAFAGAMARSTPGTVSERTERTWFRWWLAPLAAGAAAVTLWMVVPQQQQLATAPPQPPAAAEVAAPATPLQAPERQQTQAQNQAPPQPPASAPEARQDRQSLRDQDREEKKEDTKTGNVAAAREAAPATVAPRAAASDAAGASAPAPAPPLAALQRSARVSTPTDVVSPDGSQRWVFADYGDNITTGVAVSSSICWLAGRSGVVMVTTNGTSFSRVDLPIREDVVAITATDAANATATTATGRTLRTSDGGRTWR